MTTREHVLLALCLASLLAIAPGGASRAFAADLRVESLELLTHGAYDAASGTVEASTRLGFDLAIAGGDKFGGILRLGFLNGNIEEALSLAGQSADSSNYLDKLNNLTTPSFKTASVTAKSLLGLPFDLSYFVGELDYFGSGDDFVPLFGTASFSSSLRGPMVYPEGVGGDENLFYQGVHAVNGTGMKLGTSAKLSPNFASYLYLYQDSDLGSGYWSGDLRLLFNTPKVKFEAFAGGSKYSTYGIYRAGLMFFAAPGDVGEFFLQAGVPYWDPSSTISVDNLYFLFEPRINFGVGNIALTVFYHPLWYRQQKNDATGVSEKSALDTAFNFRIGKLDQAGAQGGVESILKFRPYGAEPLQVEASPYYSLITSGVQWNFKLSVKAFPVSNPWYAMFEPFIGLKTSF